MHKPFIDSDHDSHEHSKYGDCLLPSDLHDIPRRDRKCRDLPCCILFLAMWAGMFFVAGFAVHHSGDIGVERITHGMDYHGRACGVSGSDGAGSKYSHLYFPLPDDDHYHRLTLCLSGCPRKSGETICDPFYDHTTCCNRTVFPDCFSSYVTHETYHLCIPSDDELEDAIHLEANGFSRLFTDIQRTYPILIGAAFIACLVAFSFVVLMRFVGGCIVYSVIVLILVGGIVTGWFFYHKSRQVASGKAELLWVGIAVWVCTFIFFCVVLATRHSIRVAVACIEEASKALVDLKKLLLLPVVKFLIICGVFVYFAVITVYIAGSGSLEDTFIGELNAKKVEINTNMQRAFAYHLAGLIWTTAFIIAIGDIIVAGSIAAWYFKSELEGRRDGVNPVSNAISNTLWYHTGTAAFGSLVLTLVMLVRWLMEYFHKKLHKRSAESKMMTAIMCMCMCVVSCFECCVKFLSRHAYIQVAIFGNGFWHSAKQAFNLIMRNAMSVAYVDLVGGAILLIGKFITVVITATFTYLVIEAKYETDSVGAVNPVVPTVFAGGMAYVIAAVFAQVFDMSINTILHSFVADKEAHNGSAHYCSSDSKIHSLMSK